MPDQRTLVSVDIVSYGVSGGYRLTDRFSLGVGVSYYVGELLVDGRSYLPDEDNTYGLGEFNPEDLLLTFNVNDRNTDYGFNAGFLWRLPARLTLGGFFRQAPTLGSRIEAHNFADPRDDKTLTPKYDFPDIYGIGIAYKSKKDVFSAGLEWKRVEYASFVEGLSSTFDVTNYLLDDGDEYHFGVEYTFSKMKPVLALRCGAWLDPIHRVRYTGEDHFTAALYKPGGEEMHYAGGIGLSFGKFQVDVGIDLSDNVRTLSLSTIYWF